MNTKHVLTIIIFGLLPLAVFSENPPASSASAPGAATNSVSQSATASSAVSAPDAAELAQLLKDFLAGASHNDVAMHNRFWADDVIYTSSSGKRRGKADILHDAGKASASESKDEKTSFTAEDIRIQQYGSTAIVAFRLVGTTTRADKTEVMHYLNTGTFLKRNGKWQVVAWQATKIPSENDSQK